MRGLMRFVSCTPASSPCDNKCATCRARGVDSATARKVLVYSFGAEVTVDWPYLQLRDRIQGAVDMALANVPILDSEPVQV
jgi:hypothetical protein